MSVETSSGHLSIEQLERFRAKKLTPEELLSADDHLSACETCRRKALSEQEEDAILAAVRSNLATSDEHLTFEQIAAHAEGTLAIADRHAAEDHLRACRLCRADVSDLRELRKASPAVASFSSMRARRASRITPRLAAAAAVLLISAAAILISIRSNRPEDKVVTTTATQPAPAQGVLLSLRDSGRPIELREGGRVAGLDTLPENERSAIQQALLSGTIEIPLSIAELRGTTGTLMGSPGEGVPFELVGPIGTVVRQERPTFRWKPLAGARRYVVGVFDSDLNRVARSGPLSTTSWMPDAPLQRAKTYNWQVTAVVNGREIVSPAPPAAEARFMVLDGGTNAAIEAANAREGEGHLSRAARYARAGLLDDAVEELRVLVAENPDSPAARRLLESIQRGSPTTTNPAQ